MIIKTKYDIGQKVWFVHKNPEIEYGKTNYIVSEGVIQTIQTRQGQEVYNLKSYTFYVISYLDSKDILRSINIHEEDIFTHKGFAILEQQLKNQKKSPTTCK